MTKRKEYLPKPPRPPKRRGPKKLYGEESIVEILVRISASQWAEILARCPKEFRHKKAAILRWFIDESLGK